MRTCLILALLLCCGVTCRAADLHPEALADFDRAAAPYLKGFTVARRNSVPGSWENPTGASAVRNVRAWHGPALITVSVFLFQSEAARDAWLKAQQGMSSYWRPIQTLAAAEKPRCQVSRFYSLPKVPYRDRVMLVSARMMAGRALVWCDVRQDYPLMIQHPKQKRQALSDRELLRLGQGLAEAMGNQVRQLSALKAP